MEFPYRNDFRNLLELMDISLNYGQFQALKNVHFSLQYSEIHAIVGEHGAGKTSLGKIVSGILKPVRGSIVFSGQEFRQLTLNAASKLGIEMVHQHTLSLTEHFSIAENLFLTHMPFFKKLAWKYENIKKAREFFEQYGVDIDPSTPVEQLNLSDQIFVDILKHVHHSPKLLILDEALEKLASAAFNKIVDILLKLKQNGTSVLLITHRIDDIYNLADRVSIIKNGEILLTDDVRNIDKINLIKMAYMEMSTDLPVNDLNTEFYQLLKYNEAILRSLPVNLIVTDNENRIKLVNDYCKWSFGLQKDSYFNIPLSQLLSSSNEEVSTLSQRVSTYDEEKTFYQVPIILNENSIICNLKTFPVYDGAFVIGNIVIIEDITEYDQLQKQVMLSEKLASVGLLAAGVAHEINNPLEIIYTHLEFMKYKFRSLDMHEALDTFHEQIASIANIVSNLHSFSDNTQTPTDDIDINQIIQDMLNLIKHNAGYKHITIHFEPYHEELFIRASKHEIKQVILNLLKNSFEAMPSGGEIFISTTLIHNDDAHMAQIIFKDSGPGICDENPNNIFLPFYSTKKDQKNNLGLGLSISYGIINKYNGSISVENIDVYGCQFVIRLPLC